jgi:hypothetical protein
MRAFTRGPRLVRPAVRHRLAQARMCKSGGGARARRPLGGAGQPGRPVRDHGALVRRAAGPAHAARQHAVAARPQPGLRRPATRVELHGWPHACDAVSALVRLGPVRLALLSPAVRLARGRSACAARAGRAHAAICAATGALLRGPCCADAVPVGPGAVHARVKVQGTASSGSCSSVAALEAECACCGRPSLAQLV